MPYMLPYNDSTYMPYDRTIHSLSNFPYYTNHVRLDYYFVVIHYFREFMPTDNVHFTLSERTYYDGDTLLITDIGEGVNALLCVTDNTECCDDGEFFYPDGTRVLFSSNFLYRNRGEQFIGLNRRNGATSPLGRYRCDIPDASGVTRSIFINIGIYHNNSLVRVQRAAGVEWIGVCVGVCVCMCTKVSCLSEHTRSFMDCFNCKEIVSSEYSYTGFCGIFATSQQSIED